MTWFKKKNTSHIYKHLKTMMNIIVRWKASSLLIYYAANTCTPFIGKSLQVKFYQPYHW